MLPTPKKYFLTVAYAKGRSKLTAFDNALLKARVGNVEIKVAAVEHKVEKLGCAFAAVPLWY